MTEMIERVAKAMSHKDMPGVPVGLQRYRAMARAAIEELREPSEEMYGDKIGEAMKDNDPTNIWQAMIDAALNDKKEKP